jgi:nucleotide-binding universal stress UspA family protein
MYQRIMVPLDGSRLAEKALEPAADIARRRDAEIFLVRAYEPTVVPPAAIGFVDREALHKEERENILRYLEKSVRPGITCHTVVLEGAGADPLLKFADEKDIELIVMTSHGHTGLEHWLFGSIAERMVRYASCPVLTIGRKTLTKFAKELGVDGE